MLICELKFNIFYWQDTKLLLNIPNRFMYEFQTGYIHGNSALTESIVPKVQKKTL